MTIQIINFVDSRAVVNSSRTNVYVKYRQGYTKWRSEKKNLNIHQEPRQGEGRHADAHVIKEKNEGDGEEEYEDRVKEEKGREKRWRVVKKGKRRGEEKENSQGGKEEKVTVEEKEKRETGIKRRTGKGNEAKT